METDHYGRRRKVVTSVDVYQEIRRLQRDGITSQRTAAKMLGISRNTVKKYWEGSTVPWERRPYERDASVLTPEVVSFITACLDEDARERVHKQRHTARRIYNRLVDELGFAGSESSIRKAVHKMRMERGASESFVPLYFAPGSAVQIDWGEATVYMAGERQKVNLFCGRLCYSCAPFVIAYQRQNLESFLDALVRMMQYFNGVPREVIFDNARVAVKNGFGAHATAQDNYSHLAAHYGFKAVFCNPASGNEKGLVENLVGYIRRNVCVPLPRVASLEELNGKLLEHCVKYLNHRIEGKPASVAEMLTEERSQLHSIPTYYPDISTKHYPNVGRYSTVVVETNQYSVPCGYRGVNTTVKAYPNHIEVWINGACVATHSRLYGRNQESLELTHYLPILARKGRAIRFARPVQKLVPVSFLDWMENKKLTAKQMVEMLEACQEIGYQAVMQHEMVTAPVPKDPVNVQPVNLEQYDNLYTKGAVL